MNVRHATGVAVLRVAGVAAVLCVGGAAAVSVVMDESHVFLEVHTQAH